MADRKNLTPTILAMWLASLSSSSIFVAVKYKELRNTKEELSRLREELEVKKQELNEWESDLTAREGEWRHDFDVKGSDGIPPPPAEGESVKRHPRKIEIPPSQ